ncbi:hypothetical protein B0H67DRAFT_555805 [Lasiosphaeris hirsuta]|uniref:Uncharacterized protein n=1 Tax=Lasiosphaeris hirsuta TaxID=260670 RepID=A0AA40A9U0_9PEZI|nr:hypothetical protein B0H67DRAFT_555805 [Lasiosphaeris hirsuta]
MESNAKPEETILYCFLRAGGVQMRPICKITPEILDAQTGQDTVKLLLEHDLARLGTEPTAIRVLETTAYNPYWWEKDGKRALEMLWEWDPGLRVTSPMLEAARNSHDLKFLLTQDRAKLPVPNVAMRRAIETLSDAPEKVGLRLTHDPDMELKPDTNTRVFEQRIFCLTSLETDGISGVSKGYGIFSLLGGFACSR